MIKVYPQRTIIIHQKTFCKMNCSPQAESKAAAAPAQFALGKPGKWFAGLFVFFIICSFSAHAQETVTGKVTSGDSALTGVSVTVKNTTIGASTDATGSYSIKVPHSATLVFSYVGYTDQEVTVGNQKTINVNMSAAVNQMNDVVVVGYGTQKKATLTGSVSVVKGADLVKSPQPNLSNSLAGRFSGIIVNNRSGEPGYDASKITIRGL